MNLPAYRFRERILLILTAIFIVYASLCDGIFISEARRKQQSFIETAPNIDSSSFGTSDCDSEEDEIDNRQKLKEASAVEEIQAAILQQYKSFNGTAPSGYPDYNYAAELNRDHIQRFLQ